MMMVNVARHPNKARCYMMARGLFWIAHRTSHRTYGRLWGFRCALKAQPNERTHGRDDTHEETPRFLGITRRLRRRSGPVRGEIRKPVINGTTALPLTTGTVGVRAWAWICFVP